MQIDAAAASCSAGAASAGSDSTVVSIVTAGATSTADADSAQRGWNIDGSEAPDSAEKKQGVAARKHSGWLHTAVSTMIGNLQTVAAEAVARAELIASRQEVAVQSDETQQTEWLHYVTSIQAGGTTHMLHEKAVAEAIVRIYIRALHQLEATWVHELQQRQGRPSSSRAAGSAGLDATAAAAAGPGGGVGTLFEAMMGHYSQQQHSQQRAWQVYDASLWKDPQVRMQLAVLSSNSVYFLWQRHCLTYQRARVSSSAVKHCSCQAQFKRMCPPAHLS